MPILKPEEIKKIISADCHDPYNFLGVHRIDEKNIVFRTFQPYAKSIKVKSEEKEFFLDKIHDDGLFEKSVKSDDFFKYDYLCTGFDGKTWEISDPYIFLPTISDYDLYLFNQGNHYKIFEKLGAHVTKIDDVQGTSFSVWAPNAKRVSVVGNFNGWDGRIHQMRVLGSSGVWEIFIPGVIENDIYRFEIKTKNDDILLKSDPYAFYTEMRPANASIVYSIDEKHIWEDSKWIKERAVKKWSEEPISVYEVNLASWMRKDENNFLTYEEFSDKLVGYVKENGFTHVELMPVSEYPLDISWGYQVTGYFSATSRFGNPEELMKLIDTLHQNSIGVILDWVPGHFPKDAHALGKFDGTALYEHADPRLGEHLDWGTYIFNYGRNEVSNFLISNALFWVEKYHIDGLRVDAVASMLYLDYSRKEGEWIPNKFGGRENLEAIEFLKHMNSITHKYFPGVLTIAEESTSFPGVTKPVENGLGFDMKWNMGWMHDSLDYMSKETVYRKYHQNELTFSIMYAFSENFLLSISHDEVVYGKKSLVYKMPGDEWQKFANMRLFYSYMFAHPGKKLLFMGSEFAQTSEWNCNQSLDWHLLNYEPHWKMLNFVKDLNKVYSENKALHEVDFSYEGFEWIDFNDKDNSVISFLRKSSDDEFILCVFNFTPVVRSSYRIGVPKKGKYELIMNSDWKGYWGTDVDNMHIMESEGYFIHGRSHSLSLTLPPLSGMYLKYIGKDA